MFDRPSKAHKEEGEHVMRVLMVSLESISKRQNKLKSADAMFET